MSQNASHRVYKEIWQKIQEEGTAEDLSYEDHMAKVASGGYAFIASVYYFTQAAAADCSLHVGTEHFYPAPVGFAVRKYFQHTDIFRNR